MTMPYGVEYIVSEEPEDYDVQITKKGFGRRGTETGQW